MAGVYIEKEDVQFLFGINIPAIEVVTGRKVSAVWQNTSWADNSNGSESLPEHLQPFIIRAPHDIPGYRRIMSSVEIYFDIGMEDEDADDVDWASWEPDRRYSKMTNNILEYYEKEMAWHLAEIKRCENHNDNEAMLYHLINYENIENKIKQHKERQK